MTTETVEPVTTTPAPSLTSTPPTTIETPNDGTPAEPAPAAEPVPEFVPLTADAIKFPDGAVVDEPTRDAFLEVFNNQELSPGDRAQSLLDLHNKVVQAASEAGSNAWATMQETWQNEVRADPEIGGDKLESALVGVAKVIDQFGSPELRGVMDLTGAGNNIHVVKFLANVAKQLTEGGPVTGNPTGRTAEESLKALYPSMKN